MIKNGRPYSIENGSVDAALITEHPQEEIDLEPIPKLTMDV